MIVEWPITFEWRGKTHHWVISYQDYSEGRTLPTTFAVTDGKFHVGYLNYYKFDDRWGFLYGNKEEIPELTAILSDFVVRAYG